jgi:putative membrane protein
VTAPQTPLHKPMLIELDPEADLDPGAALPPPEPPSGEAMVTLARASQRRSGFLGRAALWVFGALVSFILSVAAYDFVARLLSANSVLGWIATGLMGAAALILAALALRELAALSRIRRIQSFRDRAAPARHDPTRARALIRDLAALYAGRPDLTQPLADLDRQGADIMDADALVDLAEARLMAPLDRAALAQVEAAARQVATVTALVPMALADVATAAYANLRMIRALSEIYGGRSLTLGSLTLLRRVFAAVLGAGAIALTDDLIGSFASGGVLAKLSRRFGEGVMNGALTVRVGIAAIEACRPLPFHALERPGTSATVARALAGFMRRGEERGT